MQTTMPFKMPRKPSMTAALVGDWDKATIKIGKLSATVPALSGLMFSEAELTRQRIVSKLKSQAYNWAPLRPETLTKKAYKGQDLRTLIATGAMLNAIRVIPMGPRLWFVGIQKNAVNDEGKSLATIALWHEYGTSNEVPRPFWRLEYRSAHVRIQAKATAVLRGFV